MEIAITKDLIFNQSMRIESFECDSGNEDQHLYFYHFSKTGGTSVNASLRTLALALGKRFGQILKQEEGVEKPKPEQLNPMPWILSGHTKYGYHEFFGTNLSIISVIRDPIDRVLSQYFWKYRATEASALADKGLFTDFLERHAHHNKMAWGLLGSDSNAEKPSDLAINRLSNFKYVTTTEYIAQMMSVIASVNGSPSFLVQRGKVNPHIKIKDELRCEFGARIEKQNLIDAEIFSYAEKRRRMLEEEYRRLAANPRRKATLLTGNHHLEDSVLSTGKGVWIADTESKKVYYSGEDLWGAPPKQISSLPKSLNLEMAFRTKSNTD